MLQSSLTRFHSRALVSSYHPTCVGFGTDERATPTELFLAACDPRNPSGKPESGESVYTCETRFRELFRNAPGSGMLTRCPSTTPFGLALGAD